MKIVKEVKQRRIWIFVFLLICSSLFMSCNKIIAVFFGDSSTSSSSSGFSRNVLNNTTWYRSGGKWESNLYFGNGNFRIADELDNEEGTFTISGDTVTLTSSSGKTMTGTIIGNSLKLEVDKYSPFGGVYSRIK